MLHHSKRIRWLQGIVKRWVMKMCAGDSCGLCSHKEVGFANMVKKLHLLQLGGEILDISE